jgi:hypothetical protein
MRLTIRFTALALALSFGQLVLAESGWSCVARGGGDVGMQRPAEGAQRGARKATDNATGSVTTRPMAVMDAGMDMDPGMQGDCGQHSPVEGCGLECVASCPTTGGCSVSLTIASGSAASAVPVGLTNDLPAEAVPGLSRQDMAPEPPPPRA